MTWHCPGDDRLPAKPEVDPNAGLRSDLRPSEQDMLAAGRVKFVLLHGVPSVGVRVGVESANMPPRQDKGPFRHYA